MWPAVVAVQGIAYRILAACWAMEGDDSSAARARAEALYGAEGEQQFERELSTLATAIRAGTESAIRAAARSLPPDAPPGFACPELSALRKALEQYTA
jgi:hypothetical protein